jgi:hypothetical protein
VKKIGKKPIHLLNIEFTAKMHLIRMNTGAGNYTLFGSKIIILNQIQFQVYKEIFIVEMTMENEGYSSFNPWDEWLRFSLKHGFPFTKGSISYFVV